MEELGLAPDLSRLLEEERDLIRRGSSSFGRRSRHATRASACASMARAGYGVVEIWIVMTDPASGISKGFHEGGAPVEDVLKLNIAAAMSSSADG